MDKLFASVSTHWGGVLLAALIMGALGLLAFHAGRRLTLRVTAPESMLRHVLMSILGPAKWTLLVAAVLLVLQAAPEDLPWIVGARHVMGLVLIGLCTALAMRALNGFASGVLARYPVDAVENLEARRVHTQARVLSRSA
ncbi:hypothetical protein ACQV5M_21075, partial [Leptospira sp. SA-E8]|uniref:hypothetical protein n=1 Tax=Leptospira sp. SA-E8 TaxID=3422259 RepID=UPI003EB81A2E